jgi:pSer/pThr/pTyr-binding forkhead associated (FHA) protein
LSIGRDPSNLLSIAGLSLSRRHCVVPGVADGYMICDLGKPQWHFVNGVAVKESFLHHGDQISIRKPGAITPGPRTFSARIQFTCIASSGIWT